MKKSIVIVGFFLNTLLLFPQEGGYLNNFNDNSLGSGWSSHPGITLSEENNLLKVSGNDINNLWFRYFCNWGSINLNNHPILSLRIKSDTAICLRIFLSNTESTSFIDKYVPKTSGFDTLYYDFTGMFRAVDQGNIRQIDFKINPVSYFKGTFYIDDLALGDSALIPPPVCNGLSLKIDTVQILIAADSIAVLESAPFSDTIVHGEFIDSKGMHYPNIELHYRGAFDLVGMIFNNTQRNWKVKFTKTQKYFNEREWNYNYRTNVNEKMAYDLLRKAGVKIPSARIVILYVNGVRQGPYLEFDDPDNKPFLQNSFGDNSGDLYKAATDLPYYPVYMAGLNFLGNCDSDYYYHYQKKTNNDSLAMDYSSIRKFITMLAFLPNNKFADTLSRYFDTESFMRYLVVSNFMSNWDGYPQRPKNYWIYNRPNDGKWFFIPWDLNGTFEMQTKMNSYDHMGTNSNIFYQFFKAENVSYDPEEDTGKLLVRRMMMYAQYRNAYVLEYKKALTTYLNKDILYNYLDSLSNLVGCHFPNPEFQEYVSTIAEVKTFIDYKTSSVMEQLNNVTLWDTIPVTGYTPPDTLEHNELPIDIQKVFQVYETFPNPFEYYFNLIINTEESKSVIIEIYDITGMQVYSAKKDVDAGQNIFVVGTELSQGIYLIRISSNESSEIKKIFKTK
jgi:hypothetical protein